MKLLKHLEKIPKIYFFFYLPLVIICIFVFFLFLNFLLIFWIQKTAILPLNFKVLPEAKLPIIKTEFIPQISAKGAIIMDADSKVILYSKTLL